jgi:hypothetical protein
MSLILNEFTDTVEIGSLVFGAQFKHCDKVLKIDWQVLILTFTLLQEIILGLTPVALCVFYLLLLD